MDSYTYIPKNYSLTFEPDLKAFIYNAQETITFSVAEETSHIILDSIGLTISHCALQNESTIKTDFSTTDSHLTITFSDPLKKGTYTLELAFSGRFSDGLSGWYKSRYEYHKEIQYIVTTHFEPADARRVFPCIDHPSYKATFDITLVIDTQLTAISNMPVTQETQKSGKKIVSFEQTPTMSTYLVYLGVGAFEIYEDSYKQTIIRGITTPGKKQYTTFAVAWAKQCLAFFEDYFRQPYVLPKVDLIAIPDFGAGAMENWGAITFRENLLLLYEDISSLGTKQAIAEVVAHELAHQWFGNLVTMKWWNDLWLNESFATFMAYTVVHHYFPEWHIWSDYITAMVFGGMNLDALHTSHPIQVPVENVEQINELFDEIAYNKGGSIVRMLASYVGSDAFRDGLRIYIATYQYSNTEGKDLWTAIEKSSEKQIASFMHSFITQQGFPYLTVSQKQHTIHIDQQQFFFSSQEHTNTWVIPLVMTTDRDEYKELLTKKQTIIPLKQSPKFFTINTDYAGFYVTGYDPVLLDRIGKQKEKLHYTDTLGLLHDQYVITLAHQQSLSVFLLFIEKYFMDEKDPSTLHYLISTLARIYVMLPQEKTKKIIIHLSEYALKITGFIPQLHENPHINFLRNTSLYALSLFDHREVTQFALETFTKSLVDTTLLHPDLKGIIYALAVWSNDLHYEVVKGHYRETTIQEEKAKYLSALGNSKNKKLLRNTLEFCLTSDVRFAHILYLISGVSRNPHGKTIVVDWFMENWEKLWQLGDPMIMRHLLKLIIPTCGLGKEREVLAFLNKQKNPDLEKTFQQVEEELHMYSMFVQNNS